MNPLLLDAADFVHRGRELSQVEPDKTGVASRRVRFVFRDGTAETRSYQCNHAQFMDWWKQTAAFLRAAATAFGDTDPTQGTDDGDLDRR